VTLYPGLYLLSGFFFISKFFPPNLSCNSPQIPYNHHMKQVRKFGTMNWIHYASPTPAEILALIDEYELHELIAEDLQEMTVQHKIDQYDDVIFVVLNFPKYNVTTKKYLLNEFNIILGKDSIITLSRYEATHIGKIIAEYKEDLEESDTQDEEAFKVSPYYILYTIIDAMYDKTIKAQASSSRDLVMLESSITGTTITKNVIEELMKKKANIAFLKYTFIPQREILRELQQVCGGFYE
jgi:Mg2+ and Co2+ transporter CorA